MDYGLLSNVVFGVSIGLLGIGHAAYPQLAALVFAIPILWALSSKRLETLCLMFAYYGASSRGIPFASAVFFGHTLPPYYGLLMWFTVNILLASIWAIFLPPQRKKTFLSILARLIAVIFIITVPPIGVVSWASPVVSLAYVFPYTGLFGVIAGILLWAFIAYKIQAIDNDGRRSKVLFASGSALVLLTIVLCLMPYKIPTPLGWASINTHYGRTASGSAGFTDSFIRSTQLIPEIYLQSAPYILTPETVAGQWIKPIQELWEPITENLSARKQTLVLGTEIIDENFKYDNCLLFVGAAPNVYRQRVPVPFSMWQPYGGAGTANAYWWDDGIIPLEDGGTATALICYEQFLLWPILRTVMTLQKVDLVITAANQWWSRNTSIPAAGQQFSSSWALLFNLQLISAINI